MQAIIEARFTGEAAERRQVELDHPDADALLHECRAILDEKYGQLKHGQTLHIYSRMVLPGYNTSCDDTTLNRDVVQIELVRRY